MQREEQERIAAFLSGTMPEKEAAEFERRLRDDAALAREVETWRQALAEARDWLRADPPGAERAADLEIPAVPGAGRASEGRSGRSWATVAPLRPATARALAAAALFFAGVLVGALAPRAERLGPGGERTLTAPGETVSQVPGEPEPRRYVETQNGRVIIETTLQGSGARAVWVVDGKFRLAGSPLAGG
jgi:anti-sigma factor RsiW